MQYPRFPSLITRLEDLPDQLQRGLEESERAFLCNQGNRLPFAVTPFYASLALPQADDPIRRQFLPDPRELERSPVELDDPLGEVLHRAAPRLVHQYRDRVLLLSNGTCAGYCRHCFRRVWTGESNGFIGEEELRPILEYLSAHSEVREVLVSGGDPLFASDERLSRLFAALRHARPGVLLRICTRMPAVHPFRLDQALINLLRAWRPLRLVVHLNHPRELPQETRDVLSACVDAGIPVHAQTVLLRGVNDDAIVLAKLFRELTDLGATPYYLFQGDLAPGTAHFRVPLARGIDLYEETAQLVSSLALPRYAVDLPGGGGKIALSRTVLSERKSGFFLLHSADGKAWRYPDESDS